MVRVQVHREGFAPVTLAASAAVSLLNTILKADIGIRHTCGGRAECGTCRLTIVAGRDNTNPVTAREKTRLEAVGADPDDRLACQTYVFGEVAVRIGSV